MTILRTFLLKNTRTFLKPTPIFYQSESSYKKNSYQYITILNSVAAFGVLGGVLYLNYNIGKNEYKDDFSLRKYFLGNAEKTADKTILDPASISKAVKHSDSKAENETAGAVKTVAFSSEETTEYQLLENKPDKVDDLNFENIQPNSILNPEKLEFPSHVPFLIIGAGTAGMAAARAIRASDGNSKVLMIGGDSGTGEDPLSVNDSSNSESIERQFKYPVPYMRPPLSKQLWTRSKRSSIILSPDGDMHKHSWLFYEPESFFLKPEELNAAEHGGVGYHEGDPVEHLDPDSRTAILKSGKKISYDYCLLATGGKPKRFLAVEECSETKANLVNLGRVSYFRSIKDFVNLNRLAKNFSTEGGNVVVIGGGFLGCELTCSMGSYKVNKKEKSKMKVSHVFRESAPMGSILPPVLSAAVGRHEENLTNVTTISSTEVVSVKLTEDQKMKVRIKRSSPNGTTTLEEIDADHIVCTVGVEPNTDLADEAGLEVDYRNGGYLVNAELEARAGVFVAGDASSYWDPVIGCRRRVEHLNFAEETGMLAGKNMAAAALSRDPSYEEDPNALSIRDSSKYKYQSSLWSSLGKNVSWEAVGQLDTKKLLTKSYFSQPDEQSKGRFNMPDAGLGSCERGVVFYLTPQERRLVGILLWNLEDEFYEEQEFSAPSRINLARSFLAEKKLIGHNKSEEMELKQMARDFDIYGQIAKDYKEIKDFTMIQDEIDKKNMEAKAVEKPEVKKEAEKKEVELLPQ